MKPWKERHVNMESKIVQSVQMKYSPVALIFTNEKPEGSIEFQEGRWGCVIAMLNGAAKGNLQSLYKN